MSHLPYNRLYRKCRVNQESTQYDTKRLKKERGVAGVYVMSK